MLNCAQICFFFTKGSVHTARLWWVTNTKHMCDTCIFGDIEKLINDLFSLCGSLIRWMGSFENKRGERERAERLNEKKLHAPYNFIIKRSSQCCIILEQKLVVTNCHNHWYFSRSNVGMSNFLVILSEQKRLQVHCTKSTPNYFYPLWIVKLIVITHFRHVWRFMMHTHDIEDKIKL